MTTETTAPVEEPRPSAPQTRSWFMGQHERVDLQVGSVTLTTVRDLSARKGFDLIRDLDDDDLNSAWQEYSLRKASAFLRNWSLEPALPSDEQDRANVLRTLRRSRFERIYEVIVEHDNNLEQRFYQGARYTPAEWSTYKATADAARKPEDPKLPEWSELLTYIEPVVSLAADAWFLPEDDGVTLQLPDDHWMRIKSEITQGEYVSLVARPPRGKKDEPEPSVPAGWQAARKLGLYLLDWSMVYPDGRPVPVRPMTAALDAIAEMDATRFSILHKTLEAYEALLKKEREENPTGAQ